MNFDYDVAIIGAGPIGSTLAYKLAKEDINVCLIDKKRVIGLPLQCAGIISSKIANFNEMPNELILNKVKGANIFSNSNELRVAKEDYEAFVIDRVAYDQFLFDRACKEGVNTYLSSKVTDVDIEKGIIYFSNNAKINQISSKIIVGADGPDSIVSSKLGNDFSYFNASQYLVKVDEIQERDFVNVCAKENLFPGFTWAIPTYEDIFRVGIFSNHTYKEQLTILNDFLENDFQRIPHKNEHYDYKIIERYAGKIPIFNKENLLVNERVIIIGDAGSQIKPTTGGGLIIGFKVSEIAKNNIVKALKEDDINLLNNYHNEFLDSYSKEFSYQFKVQKTLSLLSDNDIDYFFTNLKEKDCEKLISEYGEMDNQSSLVKQFLKRGLLLVVLPKLLKKDLIKIWL